MHLVMSQVCHSGTDSQFAKVAISVRLICTGLFSGCSEGHLLTVQRRGIYRARDDGGDRHQLINVVDHPTNVYGLWKTVTAPLKPLLPSNIVTLEVLSCHCFSTSESDPIVSDRCKVVFSSSLEYSGPKSSSDSVSRQL